MGNIGRTFQYEDGHDPLAQWVGMVVDFDGEIYTTFFSDNGEGHDNNLKSDLLNMFEKGTYRWIT